LPSSGAEILNMVLWFRLDSVSGPGSKGRGASGRGLPRQAYII